MLKEESKWELEQVNNLSLDYETRLRYLCRNNFLAFVRFVHPVMQISQVHKVLANTLNKVANGELRKLALSTPPRTGKSLLTGQLLPAYVLGRNPYSENMLASYALKLSRENAMNTLNFMNSERYKFLFPEVELRSTEAVDVIRCKRGGLNRIASAGSGVTGFGYGVLSFEYFPGLAILDDLLESGGSKQVIESTWTWTTEQFLTRKLPNHGIISMGTRFAKKDITGRLLEADPDGWLYLNIPALCTNEENDPLQRKLNESHWPEMFPYESLMETRKVNEEKFQTLYQGNPVSESGIIFDPDLYSYYHELPCSIREVFLSIDSAQSSKTTSDYSVISIWGVGHDNNLYLLKQIAGQWSFTQLLSRANSTINSSGAKSVVIENRSSGMDLADMLKENRKISIELASTGNKDKVSRAFAITPFLESGEVRLPYNCVELLEELDSFPMGSNDDRVDSMIYGIAHWKNLLRSKQNINHGRILNIRKTKSNRFSF